MDRYWYKVGRWTWFVLVLLLLIPVGLARVPVLGPALLRAITWVPKTDADIPILGLAISLGELLAGTTLIWWLAGAIWRKGPA